MNIQFRKVSIEDAEMILLWRNHPEVRNYSFNKSMISFDEHLEWIKKTLASDRKLMLIAVDLLLKKDIGVVLFSYLDDFKAEISIYLNYDMFGKGYGSSVIRESIEYLTLLKPSIIEVIANVVPGNIRSKKVFEKAGFRLSHHVYHKKVESCQVILPMQESQVNNTQDVEEI